MMSLEEDTTATKLNHLIHVVNVQPQLELYFYLELFAHVLMVKQDIAAKNFFFIFSLHGGLHGDSPCLSWSASSISYVA